MFKLFYSIILFLFVCLKTYSQQIKMNGIILDSENKELIEFVNIGISNKNQGTITNPKGRFSLTLPKEYKGDSITISHINYYPVKILVESINNQTIFLDAKTTELLEVIVSNKKIRTKKIGIKSYNRLLSTRVTSKTNDIIELAQRINIREKEVKVKAVNFKTFKSSDLTGVKIRINFYKNNDNEPNEKIIFKHIVQKIQNERESDWIRIDLNKEDIYIDQDFFVGIEFIPNFKNPTIVDIGAILTTGKGYRRENSLGTWEKLNGAASINVEIAY